MKTKIIIGLVIVGVVGLILLGRAGSKGVNDQANVGGSASNQGVQNLSLSKLGGGTIALADYVGKKPVVLDFWASWCPNCQRNMPHLNDLYQKYKDRVEVIGINLQEDPNTIQDFINSRGISFPIALDPSGQASSLFGVRYTNTHILIDKSGQVVRTIPGDIGESDIQSLIQ